MYNTTRNNGFTIIELIIVIVVISLITAGLIASQTIIENVKRIRFVNTVSEIKTQKTIYFSKYSAIPGDDSNASKYFGQECEDKLPGYVNSNFGSQCNGNGDGSILQGDWHRFWVHLDLASTAKALKFQYHSGVGDIDYGWIQNPYDSATEGRYSMIVAGNWSLFNLFFSANERNYKDVNILYIATHIPDRTDRGPVFTPEAAFFIDNKLDDGKPATGNIITGKSVPHPNFGFFGDGLSAEAECRNGQEYSLANKSKDCIMAINLDN